VPILCYFVTSLNYKSILKKGCFDTYLNYQFLIIFLHFVHFSMFSTDLLPEYGSISNFLSRPVPSWTLNLITEKEMLTQNIDNLHVIEYGY
jgi:hypothetical protein